jgi:hypothetical protein
MLEIKAVLHAMQTELQLAVLKSVRHCSIINMVLSISVLASLWVGLKLGGCGQAKSFPTLPNQPNLASYTPAHQVRSLNTGLKLKVKALNTGLKLKVKALNTGLKLLARWGYATIKHCYRG